MKSFLMASALFFVSQTAFSKPIEMIDCSEAGATLETMQFGLDHQKSYYAGSIGITTYFIGGPIPAGIAIVYSKPVKVGEMFQRKCQAVPDIFVIDLPNARATRNEAELIVSVPVRKKDGITNIQFNITAVSPEGMTEGYVVTATEI